LFVLGWRSTSHAPDTHQNLQPQNGVALQELPLARLHLKLSPGSEMDPA
jgi:hypothetical protein